MGWGNWGNPEQPTGYWLVWQAGLKGPAPKFKASSEQEARQKYKEKYGREPDFCVEEKG